MNELFMTVNSWMTGGIILGAAGCFLWGVISVLFSPCHLASIPLIIGYVGGQDKLLEGRKAVLYAVTFTLGLFITIACIGIICSILGRMLGDIGMYWTIAVGIVLLWVASDMLGIVRCSLSGNLMGRLRIKGLGGAFILGLAYGVLSGSCTFGFIAPIMAIITIQERIVTGIAFILLFAVGHCLPIVIAGSSTAMVKRLLASSSWQRGGMVFRRLAGILVGLLGIYFIAQPFISSI